MSQVRLRLDTDRDDGPLERDNGLTLRGGCLLRGQTGRCRYSGGFEFLHRDWQCGQSGHKGLEWEHGPNHLSICRT